MQLASPDEWALLVPSLLLGGAALLLVCGLWIWRRRVRERAAQGALQARRGRDDARLATAQTRRERQVAQKAPDTGPHERSTQVGTHSISGVSPQPGSDQPAAAVARAPADARAPTVALDLDGKDLGELRSPPDGQEPQNLHAPADGAAGEATQLDVPVLPVPPGPETATSAEPTVVSETALTEALRATEPVAEPVAKTPAATQAEPADAAALHGGLEKTRDGLWGRLRALFSKAQALDAGTLELCEEILLTSDVGVGMTDHLLGCLQTAVKGAPAGLDAEGVRRLLKAQLLDVLLASNPASTAQAELLAAPAAGKPKVVLFVGVNGVGKTTTVGKVAHLLQAQGQRAVLAAGDTFRAAAAEQLVIWGERTAARVVRGEEGADPASVMFNAVQAAQADGADVVLADTAGRLHTQLDLMDELRKVRRALSRLRKDAPDETWLVVDATTGQNALHQARAFHEALGVTGLVLTKLDGTARGGVVFAIAHELKLPVRYVGLGERAELLQPFDPEAFVNALFAG